MNILVTGGSGFVGRHLIPHLVRAGHTVRALARSASSIQAVEVLGAEAVDGDLLDAATLRRAAAGCDAVIHLAAAFDMWGDEAHFRRVNVDGTQALLDAAKAAGVRRFIYMSAASVIGGGTPAYDVDETYTPPAPPDDVYSRTKLIAEQRVIQANWPGFMTMALRPPMIWGTEHSMLDAFRDAVRTGRFMWIDGGRHRLSTVHIDRLCAVTLQALERGHGGEIYFVTDGPAQPIRIFLEGWLRSEGITVGERSVPRWLALTAARTMAAVWQKLRLAGQPPLTPSMVYMLGTEMTVDDRKARAQLGG